MKLEIKNIDLVGVLLKVRGKLNLRERRNAVINKTVSLVHVNTGPVQALMLQQGVLPANLLLKRKNSTPKKSK